MNKLTKITSSIGPNSEQEETLLKMIKEGVNVFRLNFSHDTGEIQGNRINLIRNISKKLNTPVAILVDLQGPKHRIGNFENEAHFPLKIGQKFIFDNNKALGNSNRVYLPEIEITKALNVGDRILLNDAKIEMKVDKLEDTKIEATVIRGTEIWDKRGFNLPDTEIKTSILTEKDKKDLIYALSQKVDFVALSFVQNAQNIIDCKNFIKEHSNHPIKIIAKIERPQAVKNIESILDVADGIMIARGDLAVEVPFEKLPEISRTIIRICHQKNKPVIMATQMLGSMVHNDFPLRAEIQDVATASYLLSDSTMTSEETTIGNNPIFVINTMSKILLNADKDLKNHTFYNTSLNNKTLSIVNIMKTNKNIDAIIAINNDMQTLTNLAHNNITFAPIIAISNDKILTNQLCLLRGVYPVFESNSFDKNNIESILKKFNIKKNKIILVDNETVSLL